MDFPFAVDSDKMADVIRRVQAALPEATTEDIDDYCLATDWPEGQEHQDWLDSAPVEEIVSWAVIGLRDVLAEGRYEQEEQARMDRFLVG